jgi:hypothetical protein
MRKMLMLLTATICCACGGDPPSCQDAMTSYYGAGCTFVDLQTNTPYTLNESILSCKQVNSAVPDQCRDKFDDYLFCLDGVANDSQCVDCAQEQDALGACN